MSPRADVIAAASRTRPAGLIQRVALFLALALVLASCGGSAELSAEDCGDLDAAIAEYAADSDPGEAAREEAQRLRDEWLAGGCDRR
jgi:hypothetical protein